MMTFDQQRVTNRSVRSLTPISCFIELALSSHNTHLVNEVKTDAEVGVEVKADDDDDEEE
jgi:hypothetical protein